MRVLLIKNWQSRRKGDRVELEASKALELIQAGLAVKDKMMTSSDYLVTKDSHGNTGK